jgi:hypothetical protein
MTQFLEAAGIPARKCGDPDAERRGARGFEDCEAKRRFLEGLKRSREERGPQEKSDPPWWRWENPRTSGARFFIRRAVCEGLPPLEAAEPERDTP